MDMPERYNTVVKANDLIRKSRFSLSAQQQKIVLFLISKINSFDDEEFKLYDFKITEFCEVCGIEPSGKNYSELREQIQKISDKSVWVKLDNGNDTLLRWIEKPYINENSGIIQIRFDNDMKPFLLQLQENFTKYELIYTLNFKSKYSIRLYEYLKSIHYNKLNDFSFTVEINEFQKLLESPYTAFRDFNTKVLKIACKEINEYSDIIFSYDFIKSGRKVTAIKIHIQTKDSYERIVTSAKDEKLLETKGGKE